MGRGHTDTLLSPQCWMWGSPPSTIPFSGTTSILTCGSPTKMLGWHVVSLGLPQAPNTVWSPFLDPDTENKQEAKYSKQKRSSSWKRAPKTPNEWTCGPDSKGPWCHGGDPGHREPRDGVPLDWCFSRSHLGPSLATQRNTSKCKGRL